MNFDASRARPATLAQKCLVLTLAWAALLLGAVESASFFVAANRFALEFAVTGDFFAYAALAFVAGYALSQLPGGVLADLTGVRWTLAASIALSGLAQAVVPHAPTAAVLVALRFVLGFASGLAVGPALKALGDTFTSSERSAASGVLFTGAALGLVVAAGLGAVTMPALGWHGLFYAPLAPALALAALVTFAYPRVVPVPSAPVATGLPAGLEVLRGFAACAATLFSTLAVVTLLDWLPSLLIVSRGVDPKIVPLVVVLPKLAGLAGLLGIGVMTTRGLTPFRPFVAGACYLFAAASLLAGYFAPSIPVTIAGVALATFFLYGGTGPFWAIAFEGLPARFRGTLAAAISLGGTTGLGLASVVAARSYARDPAITLTIVCVSAALAAFAIALTFRPRRSPVAPAMRARF